MQAASLKFPEVLLSMVYSSSSAASTDILQLPNPRSSLAKRKKSDGPAGPAVCAGLFGGQVQVARLKFPEIFLSMVNSSSSAVSTDILQLPIPC